MFRHLDAKTPLSRPANSEGFEGSNIAGNGRPGTLTTATLNGLMVGFHSAMCLHVCLICLNGSGVYNAGHFRFSWFSLPCCLFGTGGIGLPEEVVCIGSAALTLTLPFSSLRPCSLSSHTPIWTEGSHADLYPASHLRAGSV
jgi:hypothetical protein